MKKNGIIAVLDPRGQPTGIFGRRLDPDSVPWAIHDPVNQPRDTAEAMRNLKMAPRLDKLDGKRITVSVGAGGEQGILIPLVKKLPEKYPQVNWNISYAAPHATKAGSVALADGEMDKTDALIRGVVW